jgi:putative flippase GtrA
MVGCLAAGVHLVSEVVLVELLFLHPLVANIFAFLIAFIASFTGQHFFTFSAGADTVKRSLPRFFLIALGSFVLNQALFALALALFPVPYFVALFAVLFIVAIGTFLLSKQWAFKK